MSTKFTVTILEDGTVRISTSDVAGDVHKNAEDLMATLAEMLGGPQTRQARTDVKTEHHHHHEHGHEHHA